MAYFQIDSDHDSLDREDQTPKTFDICVLKYLEKPNKILQKQTYEFLNPKCLYQMPLHKISQAMKFSQTQRPNNIRLIGLQQTEFEHKKIKEKITKIFSKNEKGLENGTLSDIYGSLVPQYMRFTNNNTKNFASIMINVKGLILLDSNKRGLKQQIPKSLKQYSQINTGPLRFDSHFESGNLLYAYRKPGIIDTYDLILQNDTYTKGHNQWFFFKIQNQSKNHKIKINIINMIKKDSLFNYGQKILVYSQCRNAKTGKGWMRQGQRITYEENNIRRQNKQANHYTLSFQYTFKQQHDTIFMCPTYPYTFTNMTHFLQKITKNSISDHCFSIKNIAQTIGGNKVNLISISTGKKNISDKNVKIIWIIARQHPSETTSSFMVEGIIEYLLNLMQQHQNIQQQQNGFKWIDYYHFKIIPMVNIDGVIHGNSRSQLTGVDPNRMWHQPIKRLAPNIREIKKHILQSKENIDMILDLHSHSKKTGCFFYGNTTVQNPKISKVYPSFVCQNDDRFSFNNSRFHGGYQTTLRRVLFSQLNNFHNIFTVQCSLYGYQKQKKMIDYTITDLKQMGAKLISSYFHLEKVKRDKQINRIIFQRPQLQKYKEEIGSARSESSLSDEQYSQLFQKTKNNKVKNHLISNKVKVSKSMNPKSSESKILGTSNIEKRIKTFTNYDKLIKNSDNRGIIRKKHKKENLCSFPAISDAQRIINQSCQKKYIYIRNIVRTRVASKYKKQSEAHIHKKHQSVDVEVKKATQAQQQLSYQQTNKCEPEKQFYQQKSAIISKNEFANQIFNKEEQIDSRDQQYMKVPKLLNYISNNMIGKAKQNNVQTHQKKIINSRVKHSNISRNVFGIRN